MEILLIEGDLELLENLTKSLTDKGHSVKPVSSTDEELNFFIDNLHTFDVIITNIDLKGEGLTLLERIQRDKHEIPVIAMTVESKIDIPMKLIEYGVFELILKVNLCAANLLAVVSLNLAKLLSKVEILV